MPQRVADGLKATVNAVAPIAPLPGEGGGEEFPAAPTD